MKPASSTDVFLTSPWIPAEWIRAHGLQPRGVWSAENFQLGAWPLSAGLCAFAEAAVRFAESRTDAAVIFSTACDQMRRGFDAAMLHGHRRAFLFNLPATWQTAAAGQIWRSELERLGQFLLAVGGRAPSPEALRLEMSLTSRTRARLLESASTSSARGFAEAVARFHWDGGFSPPPTARSFHRPKAAAGSRGCVAQVSNLLYRRLPVGRPYLPGRTCGLEIRDTTDWKSALRLPVGETREKSGRVEPAKPVPLALVGGPFLETHWKWLEALEAAGGCVALDATEMGERSLWPAFEFEAGTNDAFEALVRGCCDHMISVFQRPNTRLYSWLKPRLASRRVRGIVLWHFTGCDLWRAEAQTLKESFGLPVLLCEAGAEPGAAPRELNRLQAFVETLR